MSKVYFRFYDPKFIPPNEYKPFKNCYALDSEYIKPKKLWSTYKVQPAIVQYLVDKNTDIKYNMYVICPLYAYNGAFSDFQFGVTETRKIGESDESCFKRALSEEIGLRYSSDILPKSFVVENYGKKFKMFTLNIKDPSISPVMKSNPSDNILDDKYATKCGAVVYGTENDIFDFLNRKDLIFDKNDDVIVGTVAIKFSEAISHFYKKPSPYKRRSPVKWRKSPLKARKWSTKKKKSGKRSRKSRRRRKSKSKRRRISRW